MAITTTWDYDTPSNFEYNSDLIEISGGVAKLKNRISAEETFFASYDSSIDAERSAGVATGTATGGATIDGNGNLDLAQGDLRYVDYAALANADSAQEGCARFVVIPNYSGTPTYGQMFFNILSGTDIYNQITVYQSNTGDLWIIIRDSAGNNIVYADLGAWSPTKDTEYHFELNWDLVTGATRLFVDGQLFGTTQTATGTRTTAVDTIRIGTNRTATTSFIPNFKMAWLQIFNSVQHTTNFTPTSEPLTTYSTDNPTIVLKEAIRVTSVLSGTETATIVAPDEIKRVAVIDGVDYWWNGSAFVVSDGTYDQANTALEMGPNLPDLPIASSGSEFKFKLFLHSDDGSTTPELDAISITYNYFQQDPGIPSLCLIYGVVLDAEGNAAAGATISFTPKEADVITDQAVFVGKYAASTTTNNDGYFEIKVVRSSEYKNSSGYYQLEISYNSIVKRYEQITIPDQSTIEINDLISSL